LEGALANWLAQQLPATSTLQDACNDFLNRFNFYCGSFGPRSTFSRKLARWISAFGFVPKYGEATSEGECSAATTPATVEQFVRKLA
jgi:hypothetical protein